MSRMVVSIGIVTVAVVIWKKLMAMKRGCPSCRGTPIDFVSDSSKLCLMHLEELLAIRISEELDKRYPTEGENNGGN